MNFTPISTNFCAKPSIAKEIPSNLKRLCEYQGPILKLTPKDRAKISVLNKEIAKIETDMYKLGRYMSNCKDTKSRMYYSDQMLYFSSQIEIMQNQIKNIKTERFLKQKNLYNKRHAV